MTKVSDVETETLREIADSAGLSKLSDANLPDVENALTFAQLLTERMPNTLVPTDEPAHIYPAAYPALVHPHAQED